MYSHEHHVFQEGQICHKNRQAQKNYWNFMAP